MDLNVARQGAHLYNALGQQVSRDVGGAVTVSVHDLAGNRIAEHDGAGVVIREYIWLDGRPLAVVEGGQVYHLHWDHILRPVLATGSAGAELAAQPQTRKTRRIAPFYATSTNLLPVPGHVTQASGARAKCAVFARSGAISA